MAISYNKLWKVLIDQHVSKAELRRNCDIAPNTLTKLNKELPVSMEVLCRICEELGTDFGDIVEYIPEPKTKGKK